MSESSAVVRRLADLRDAVTTAPPAPVWGRCALVYLAFLLCALPLGLVSGLLHVAVAPLSPAAALVAVLTMLAHPAITEEIVFRALLLPRRLAGLSRARVATAIVVALALYVAAHPLNARVLMPAALPVFTNPWYLALAALLGLACTAAYLLSGSLWPPVVMHWITVAAWILLLGGDALVRRP